MRRLALLVAGGALWLVLAAIPASADGGPHSLALNSGTGGLTGDCAACHRAHTAQAADLLKAEEPALCTNCHNGTGATTNVINGIQYTPATWTGATSPIMGALRGGGFNTAVIDTSNASRLTYNRSGGTQFVLSAAATTGTFQATFAAIPSIGFAGGSVTIDMSKTATGAGSIQTDVDVLFGTSATYNNPAAAAYLSGTPSGNRNVVVSKATDNKSVTLSYHNAFRTVRVALPTISSITTGGSVTPVDTTTVSATAAVGVRSSGPAVTSTHEGTGTVWGNGAQGASYVGTTGVVLDCTKCHNPHGNGQYRILQTTPGEDWNTATGVNHWTPAANDVQVVDGPALTAGQVRNYTVLPGALATDVTAKGYSWTQGDYFRRKFDGSGTYNWTNFYLRADDMNTGWTSPSYTTSSGTTVAYPTNNAALPAYVDALRAAGKTTDPITGATVPASGTGSIVLSNRGGLMTAWCITCHTRYSGQPTVSGGSSSPSSLTAMTPTDPVFMFKHGTTGVGCEQCHVSHGTNAQMVAGTASASVKFPDGSAEDSALLKVDNRGTCNLCHDPTGTVDPGVFTGSHPSAITPGP